MEEPLTFDEVSKGDLIQLIDANTLPERYREYVGETFEVISINNDELHVQTEDKRNLGLIEGEFIRASKFYKHKSKLNI